MLEKLTPQEMEVYQKSVLEYDDIVDALSFERKQSEARGEKRGEKRGIAIGMAKGMARGIGQAYAAFVFSCATDGMSLKKIAGLTQLSVEQVQAILQEHKK
jgi:predicted transposase YdaD